MPGRSAGGWHWGRAAIIAAGSALTVGVPTDVIDTDLFTRMTPVRWWEYPVLVLTVLLTGMWAAIPQAGDDGRGSAGVMGSTLAAAFAVGCPVCNKLVVGLLGLSGALGVWAPLQPALAGLSVIALGAAVVVRWRRRTCTAQACDAAAALPDNEAQVAQQAVAPPN